MDRDQLTAEDVLEAVRTLLARGASILRSAASVNTFHVAECINLDASLKM
jgi:hypothetical protein